jgi:uncharacterized protein YkwD
MKFALIASLLATTQAVRISTLEDDVSTEIHMDLHSQLAQVNADELAQVEADELAQLDADIAEETTLADVSTANSDAWGKKILVDINEYRVAEGHNKLEWNQQIANLCKEHAVYMVKQDRISHDGFVPRVYRYEGGFWGAAENVASNTGRGTTSTPAAALTSLFTQWKNSAGHNANMLNKDYSDGGLAVVSTPAGNGQEKFWACHMFRRAPKYTGV